MFYLFFNKENLFEHLILASLSIYRCWSSPDSSYGGRLAGGLLTTFTGYVPLSEIKKGSITSKKNHQLTGFSVFIDVSLCFVYQGQGLIRKSEILGRLCPRALCRLRSKYPNPIMNVVKVVALLKVLCFILEIFLSCRSDLGGGMGGLARSPADNRPYFALIFGATLALFGLFFLKKIGLPNTEKASNRVPTLNPKTQKKLATLGYSVDLIYHTLTG